MRLSLLLPLFALAACDGKDADDSPADDSDNVPTCAAGDADNDGSCDDADCDPTDPYTYPGANDIPYDGKDNDCAGDGDLVDVDRDGYNGINAGGDDCNDGNPTIFPGAEEICYDGIDQDCAGNEDSNDCDGDGFDGNGSNAADCDDENADIYPGQVEIWYDGIDEDCSGYLDSDYDADGDGDDAEDYGGTDCDDTNARIAGGNPEYWDGIDGNCDGEVDAIDIGDSYADWYGDRGVQDGFMGMGLAALNDYDGDGFRSMAVSGWGTNDAGAKGAVYVIDVGDEAGQLHNVATAIFAGDEGEYFGFDVANVGDLDNDGLDELMLSSPIYNNGIAWVYDGATVAAGGEISKGARLASLSGNTYLGIDVAGIGDINGDGIEDVAAGTGWLAPTHVVVYSGADVLAGGNLSPVSALTQIDNADGDYGGQTVGGLDFDGDGIGDFLVGSYTSTTGVTHPVSGIDASQGNALDVGDLPWIRGYQGEQIGVTSGWMNDINGNGYPEILVRGYGTAGGASAGGGTIWVVDANDFTGGHKYASNIAFYTVNGTVENGHLQTPERTGDHDGDGVEDLALISAGDRAMAWTLDGATGVISTTYVHLSDKVLAGGTVLASESAITITGNNDDDLTGYNTLADDLNGDGRADLTFGAPASSANAGSVWVLLSELGD